MKNWDDWPAHHVEARISDYLADRMFIILCRPKMGNFSHDQLRAMFRAELEYYSDVIENTARFRGCDVNRLAENCHASD